MHCLFPLVSGIRGAENGFVDVFKRATSVYATIYPDFEGSSSSVPVASLSLDANGGRVAFVNEPVDVIVWNPSKTTQIRRFGAGAASPDVEVRSTSFTGTDYGTAAVAPGNPTTLQAVLDRWLASGGAVDWNVLIGGVATSQQNAFSSLSGIFYNVKAAAYGAVGDGATDDTLSVQAALTAAQANGGGIVFFPKGTYKITSALTVGSTVALLGAGASASRIAIAHASRSTLTYGSTTSVDWQSISGLALKPSQANTGNLLNIAGNVKLVVDHCYLGNGSVNGNCVGSSVDNTTATFLSCTFEVNGDAARHLQFTAGSPIVIASRFVFPATFPGIAANLQKGGTIAGCVFEGGVAPSGATYTVLIFNATAPSKPSIVIGCEFGAPASGVCSAIEGNAGCQVHEMGNRYGSGVTAKAGTVAAAAASVEGQMLGTRDVRKSYLASDASPLTVECGQYGSATVVRSTNGNQTLTMAAAPSVGLNFALTYWNNSGGNIAAVSYSANVKGAGFALNAGLVTTVRFVSVDVNGNLYWVIVGTQAGYAA